LRKSVRRNFIPLTFDEHRDLGHEIKTSIAKLRVLRDVVVDVYGPGNRAAFSFEKALEAMEHLQQDLATQAAWDLPGYSSNHLYFEGEPPAVQARAATARLAPPGSQSAYSSAPPLLPVVKTEPVVKAVEDAREAPRLRELREGFGETD
jgi:hypothetical protein